MLADDGPGIPEPMRDKVFEGFTRFASSDAKPGSGLGLSLAAAIADLHGSAVELSDNQPGLRVTLRFPLQEAVQEDGWSAYDRAGRGRPRRGAEPWPESHRASIS